MTTSEVKEKIANSIHVDWFNSLQLSYNLTYLGFSQTFTGVSAIFEFITQQISGWEVLGANIPGELKLSIQFFQDTRNKIEQLINDQSPTQGYLNNQWNQITTQVVVGSRNFPFLYNAPETEFLINVYKGFPNSYQAAYRFIINNYNMNQVGDKNSLIGVLLAYEFTLKDKSDIVLRENAEHVSLSKIKSDFQKYLTESEVQLSKHLKDANKNYETYIKFLDDSEKENQILFKDWFKKSQDEFTEFTGDSSKKIQGLEKTYEELLSLEKPAEYWKQRGVELKKEGWRQLTWLMILVLIGAIALYFLLWKTPEGMLTSIFSNDSGEAIRWSVVFITFISFLAFGIRALTKVTFSSFHLARDAEERERLTYVYLAMIKNESINKEDRSLVLQSLFSRADTGLLKDDSGPTMPGITDLLHKHK